MGIDRETIIVPDQFTPGLEFIVTLLKNGQAFTPLRVSNVKEDVYVYVTKEGHLQLGKDDDCPWKQREKKAKPKQERKTKPK